MRTHLVLVELDDEALVGARDEVADVGHHLFSRCKGESLVSDVTVDSTQGRHPHPHTVNEVSL